MYFHLLLSSMSESSQKGGLEKHSYLKYALALILTAFTSAHKIIDKPHL